MPTDPAVEALAEVIWQTEAGDGIEPGAWQAESLVEDAARALDHIAAHLHDDTPEGAALRERLGLHRTLRVAQAEALRAAADDMEAHARRQIALPSNGNKGRQKARDKQRGHNAGATLNGARILRQRADRIEAP